MFKPTANAGGKGGVLDRDNPLLEEKFAVIGDGEHEYVLLSFCSSFVFERGKEYMWIVSSHSRYPPSRKSLTDILTISLCVSSLSHHPHETNETDANRACTNIHRRKGTTSIQSPPERSLKTYRRTGTARCAARPSQSSNPSEDKSLASNKTKATGLERTA
jgi:hypothetical protein